MIINAVPVSEAEIVHLQSLANELNISEMPYDSILRKGQLG